MDPSEKSFNNLVPSISHVADRYCDDSWVVPYKTWNLHNFMFVLSGEGTAISEGKEYKIEAGTLMHHYAGQKFGCTSTHNNHMHMFVVNFQLASAIFDLDKWSFDTTVTLPFDNFTKIQNIDKLMKLFSKLSTTWDESSIHYELDCQSIFLAILHEFWNQIYIENSSINRYSSVQASCTYINNNYHKSLTLNDIAMQTGLNHVYFGNLFKKVMGITPIEYLNKIRIEKSLELLSAGHSIKETALLVGFSDPYYFSKVFKKAKGASPKYYMASYVNF